jgi:Coenzyme PQQ synthesis protein D (PqqD)
MSTESIATARRVVRQSSGDAGFVTRRVAGETIVVPVSRRVGDLDAIYTFNEVGSRIWALVESPTSVDEIVSALCDEFDAPREQIARDVNALLEELHASGLVNLGGGPDA